MMNNDEEPSGKSSPQASDPASSRASEPSSNQPNASQGSVLIPGLEGRYEADVRPEWTRAHFQAHLPAVFSTPAMIGMMEAACTQAITTALPPGTLSVGTRIEVDHLKALPVGAHVVATARLLRRVRASSLLAGAGSSTPSSIWPVLRGSRGSAPGPARMRDARRPCAGEVE